MVFSRMANIENLISPRMTPEESLDVNIVREKIRRVFEKLQPVYRQVLILKYMEGASVEAIAGKLAITFKSAESRLFRARKRFVEAFVNS